MENKVLEAIQEFGLQLQSLSAKPLEDLEIILPLENYKQLEYEMRSIMFSRASPEYGTPKHKFIIHGMHGIKVTISCKELNDGEIQNKLQECFKILSK